MSKDVKQRLKAAWFATGRVDRLWDRYQAARSRAERMTPAYSLAPGGNGNKDMSETVAKLADMEHEYHEEVKAMQDAVKDVQLLISSLDDYRMRLILEDRYLSFQKWEEIAVARHYSYQWVLKVHNRALELLKLKLQQAIKSDYKV